MFILVLPVGVLAFTAENGIGFFEVEQGARRDADDESVAEVVRDVALLGRRFRSRVLGTCAASLAEPLNSRGGRCAYG